MSSRFLLEDNNPSALLSLHKVFGGRCSDGILECFTQLVDNIFVVLLFIIISVYFCLFLFISMSAAA